MCLEASSPQCSLANRALPRERREDLSNPNLYSVLVRHYTKLPFTISADCETSEGMTGAKLKLVKGKRLTYHEFHLENK